jgi:hypothetical protein
VSAPTFSVEVITRAMSSERCGSTSIRLGSCSTLTIHRLFISRPQEHQAAFRSRCEFTRVGKLRLQVILTLE